MASVFLAGVNRPLLKRRLLKEVGRNPGGVSSVLSNRQHQLDEADDDALPVLRLSVEILKEEIQKKGQREPVQSSTPQWGAIVAY
jgi:hypothetical protein